ncbi:hypothetical protein GLOTRDRAFT_73361 [Gloeophyllum trabeum ATCC 11539]|uniref:Uncharacterized protein n=1 Tax=Gloeophyllum trabeum (strain ATCC 11539 / FP-39264 / Madison 617) TaxID=670483 RepID=S7QAE2_GLOTA|nr:uncharacterized protein GLOTRDRAFT_73361 [Gloeophyllum trabeum ATCC 11539]EPQ56891.1 hypothetical protein GLOTRDRAFT_73361 [Gloeophyllum trabeum ATCC 11539]
MHEVNDALVFAGLEGCAADREYAWHLAADRPEMWDRFPAVTSWKWQPAEECHVRPLDGAAMTKDLVEQGGWLLLGDSITENHFFSLSCLLYPHVRATPNYTENPYYDRAWAQHLYLSPTSPLIPHLSFPPGFSIEETPLVTFRRVDLLLSQDELRSLHRRLHPEMYARNASFSLFSEEQTWSLSPTEYMPILFGDPPNHYATLVTSTAGHWTTTLFAGYRDESVGEDEGYGIQGVLQFFNEAMEYWASEVQRYFDTHKGRERRQVIIRAYLPGHEDCHNHREPWTEYKEFDWKWYNWFWIRDFNRIFQSVLSSPRYPDIHFLPIDRPASLRPDAHSTGDCLHIMTGAGVLEGWSHYIWHYITRELPGRIR